MHYLCLFTTKIIQLIKIYRVSFQEPVGSQYDFYFGSLAAIYEVFTADDIGCQVSRLWAVKITPGHPYENAKCIISQEFLVRKKSKRGGTK